MKYSHVPVMLAEVLQQLVRNSNGTYVDCTLGGAGHALEIVKIIEPTGFLIGIDRDNEAIISAKKALSDFSQQVFLKQTNFSDIDSVLMAAGVEKVDGFLWDLGVSSAQLEWSKRGFSYKKNGPLDMRMNTQDILTAYKVVNEYNQSQLANIFQRYGEEKFSSRIASFIVSQRKRHPFKETFELVKVIKEAIPASARRAGGHPAKRVFQAIRIEVNKELENIQVSLSSSLKWTAKGGRLVVISYHSLEDRVVKTIFNDWAKGCICPPRLPVCVCGQEPKIKIITKKPILPSKEEVDKNPRARSAKMRVAEKL